MKAIYLAFWIFVLACSTPSEKEQVVELPVKKVAISETPPAPKLSNRKQVHDSIHKEALEFCKSEKYSTNFYCLVDMQIHSGKNRFLVYDFKNKKYTYKKLVTHGICDVDEPNDSAWQKAKFSNRANSHCSSKGKYKIGKRDYSSWGINVKYWLHGLENTNNNAEKRVVVLHSWSLVADEEVYPFHSPLSWGCPAVSNEFMTTLDKKLKKERKPVLLWIVE